MSVFNQYPYISINDLNLDWIIKHFKEFIDQIASLNDWRAHHEREYEELKALYDQLEAGQLPPAMYNQLRVWLNNNAVDILGAAIKTVMFDLTPDGYLRARIPESWNEIIFGTTGLDIFPTGVDFGHLTLTY